LITVLLCLPDLSLSIDYRVYRERFDSIPLLIWWVQRTRAMPAVKSVAILCHSDEESIDLADMLGDSVGIYVSSHNTLLRALAQYASQAAEERVAIAQLSLPLGPQDLLSRVYAHHLEHSNAVTEVTGLPQGATPTLFESEVLHDSDVWNYLDCQKIPWPHFTN